MGGDRDLSLKITQKRQGRGCINSGC